MKGLKSGQIIYFPKISAEIEMHEMGTWMSSALRMKRRPANLKN
jgi:hypothetical protein